MQKNVPDHAPEELIGRHEVPKEGGGTTVYPMVDSVEGIAFFANLGAIDLPRAARSRRGRGAPRLGDLGPGPASRPCRAGP